MAYGDDIEALGCQHRWSFDGDSLDSVGSADGTDTSALYTSAGICKDVTNCMETDAISDRISIPTTTDINNSAQTRKILTGWLVLTGIQNPPKNAYGEGDATQSFRFIIGWGNRLMYEVNTATSILQIFGDVPLEINRSYHLALVFEGTGYGNIVKGYLDGILQEDAEPSDRVPDVVSLPARGVAEFGDPAGTVAVGGVAVVLIAPINGKWNEWNSFDGVSLSDSDIRVELFEKGALGDTVITSGTESAIQTQIDGEADSVGPDVACDIEVQAVTGDGDLEITLDNRTFDPLASLHVKYLGTGTLTVINTNGSNAEQAKCSAPWGTIVVENPTSLTINFTQSGSEVRIYDDNGVDLNDFGTELDGVETSASTSFVFSHSGISNDIVIQIMKDNYEEVVFRYTLDSNNSSLNFIQRFDLNE